MEMCFRRSRTRRLSFALLVLTVTFLTATYLSVAPRRDMQRSSWTKQPKEQNVSVSLNIHSLKIEARKTADKQLIETDNDESETSRPDNKLNYDHMRERLDWKDRPDNKLNDDRVHERLAGKETLLDWPENELNYDQMRVRLARKENMLGKKFDRGKNCTKVLPQALIVGVMKGGTETLSTFLAIHPEIAMQMKLQAVLFFNKNYAKGYEWYRNEMACSSEGQITMEKSPQYFTAPYAPERIHAMDISVKLIIIVREPIKRAISHYTHVLDTRPGRYPDSFEKTVMIPSGEIDLDHEAILLSLYSVQIKRWLQYFKMDQIHIVDGENFKVNPAEELNKVENFLGLNPYITQESFAYNTEKGFFCLNISQTGGTKGCMPRGKGRQHPETSPDVIEKLKQFFKPYNEDLFDIIGKRFDWGY